MLGDPLRTILVVDDDDSMREVIAWDLTDNGYCVVRAQSAAAAVVTARDLPLDLVLTDVDMPDRSGLELLADLKAHFPSLPVVLMTGGVNVTETAAVAQGAAALLIKPFNHKVLLALVAEILARSPTQRTSAPFSTS